MLTLKERYALATRTKGDSKRKRKDLSSKVEFAKGMKVMVINNIETDLDVTNGARGEVVDIVLHPNEPCVGDKPVVELKYLPSYILAKLTRTRATRLEGLEECVIPVEATSTTMQIKIKGENSKMHTRTVQRRQMPTTPAYAFTDYRSQGQTIENVIVDIASPPSGTLSLFNLYVAISRSHGRSNIRIVRDFDPSLFHDEDLALEDNRFDELDRNTSESWKRLVQLDLDDNA